MKHTFYVPPDRIQNQKVDFSQEQIRKIKKVLRLKEDSLVRVCDGMGGVYSVLAVNGGIKDYKKHNKDKKVYVKLYLGVSKLPSFEFALQKAVEIGVDEIIPVLSKNSVVKIQDFNKKNSRFNKIALSAFCQCKRVFLPIIKGIESINEINPQSDLNIVAFEGEENLYLKTLLEDSKNCKTISILTGPEGGLDINEIKMLKNNKFIPVKLTNNILRSETAVIFTLASIYFFFGE